MNGLSSLASFASGQVASKTNVDTKLDPLDTSTYAPNFSVLINGSELHPETHSDVLDISVTLEKDKPAGFSLTVNDWDDHQVFGATSPAGSLSTYSVTKYSSASTFDPGTTVTILLGYGDKLLPVITAQVTSLSVRFPESGSPSLAVGGQDQLRELANRKPKSSERKQWKNVPDWKIVEEIAARVGMPVHVDRVGEVMKSVVMQNQDYASFLLERAKANDFEVYIDLPASGGASGRMSGKSAAGHPTLFFVQRRDGRKDSEPNFRFRWGNNLISFTTRLSTTQAVKSVTVRGWDSENKRPIVFTADHTHLPKSASGEQDGTKLAAANAAEEIKDQHVTSIDEARALAISELIRRCNTVLTGSAKVVGFPELRPGMLVGIGGLGPRFDNDRYQVQKVTHTLGAGGFLTDFDVCVASSKNNKTSSKIPAKGSSKPLAKSTSGGTRN